MWTYLLETIMNRHLDKERTQNTYGVEILTEDLAYIYIYHSNQWSQHNLKGLIKIQQL